MNFCLFSVYFVDAEKGSLEHVLATEKLTFDQKKQMIRDIASGLHHMHQKEVTFNSCHTTRFAINKYNNK
jgi:hypothetical protein